MSDERSKEEKKLDERSAVLTRKRLQDERSSEIAHIKDLERSEDNERADTIKDIARADTIKDIARADTIKDIARADTIKDIARAESIRDMRRFGLLGPCADMPQSAQDRVAADIFSMATSLGGYLVVGVVVPMTSTPSPMNGSAARIAGLSKADADDREQKAAAAKRTIEQMTEGALRQRRRR